MKLLLKRNPESNPLVIKYIGNNVQGQCFEEQSIEGKFYRVFPSDINDIRFIQSLEKYINVFPPAIGNGNGVFIKASLIDDNENIKAPVSLKLKCLTQGQADELGYVSTTIPINVDSEQSIILSMQDSMKGKNAVWIVTNKKNKNNDNSGLYVQLGILRESIANESATKH